MTTIAIIGAGRGVGDAVARRFGREGFAVALVSRTQANVDAIAADLSAEGVTAAGFAADARDAASLVSALELASSKLGPIEVLQYSPIPAREFLKSVEETTPDDVRAAVEFSVLGSMAATQHVLPGMRQLGRGTVIFVNGGSAVRPNPRVAGTSIAFAAESAYAQILHETLAPEHIHVAQLIIPGGISPDSPDTSPTLIADRIWSIHSHRQGFREFQTPLS